jgi:hypothetical protein
MRVAGTAFGDFRLYYVRDGAIDEEERVMDIAAGSGMRRMPGIAVSMRHVAGIAGRAATKSVERASTRAAREVEDRRTYRASAKKLKSRGNLWLHTIRGIPNEHVRTAALRAASANGTKRRPDRNRVLPMFIPLFHRLSLYGFSGSLGGTRKLKRTAEKKSGSSVSV